MARTSLRQKWLAIACALAVIGAVLVAAAPAAEAVSCTDPTQVKNQADLSKRPVDCRFFVSDPGFNELIDGDSSNRASLLASEPLYLANGFTQNFLWYARQDTIRVHESGDLPWTGCNARHAPGTDCEPATASGLEIVTEGRNGPYTVFTSIAGAKQMNGGPGYVDLDVFIHDDMWIARVCGNWHAIDSRPKPVPTIPIEKFDDVNRNGERDAGEGPVSSVQFDVRRVTSRVGETTGPTVVRTVTTNATGRATVELDGLGPGRYSITEQVPSGSFPTTDTVRYVDVDFGLGDSSLPLQVFGNAVETVDVAKTSFTADLPDNFDARTDTEVTVDVEITNHGPADHVPVRDVVELTGPADCTIRDARREFETILEVGETESRSFTFIVNCDRPSFHEFEFDDELTVTDSRLTDTNPSNNRANFKETRPVWAETDLSTSVGLDCPTRTDVDVTAVCTVSIDVTNNGYGPIASTSETVIEAPSDCTVVPATIVHSQLELDDGDTWSIAEEVAITCSYRSFHPISAAVEVGADDIHVIDVDTSNDAATADDVIEVFHDADLRVDDISLFCDEVDGATSHTCTAIVDVSNSGPAPDVMSLVDAELTPSPDCTIAPSALQSKPVTLAIGVPQSIEFTWTLDCSDTSMLHPNRVEADVRKDEPHPVDVPGPVTDDWIVPVCMPTVNPDGRNEPAAPGNGGQGQNQDGFYEFGSKSLDGTDQVWVEDMGTGTVFGPFESGVRIKYVEANGATPSIRPMGGNNGRGGSATAVDYQIKGQGDAAAVFFDEDGNVIRTACLVPPFPQ